MSGNDLLDAAIEDLIDSDDLHDVLNVMGESGSSFFWEEIENDAGRSMTLLVVDERHHQAVMDLVEILMEKIEPRKDGSNPVLMASRAA